VIPPCLPPRPLGVPLAAALVVAAVVAAPTAVSAQSGRVVIDITQPQRSLYPLAIPEAVGSDRELAKAVTEVASFDMSVAGWFRVLDPRSFLANLDAEALSIDPKPWEDVGAFGVMKYRAERAGDRIKLTFKLYEVEKGARPVLERDYQGGADDARALTHRWCNDMVEYFTGERGFFGARLAFVAKSKEFGTKQVFGVDFDGHGVYSLTRNRSINILPAWSPSGDQLAFTSYMRTNPDLYVVGSGGGRPRRLARFPGMNTGASWSPDGSKLALTLSKDGNPEIYVLNAASGEVVSRLTNNRAIDTSPAWSPTGRELAFVSNREGGPQVFVMSADGSNQLRVSRNGDYNTTPVWSPQKGKRILAYTTRGDEGNFDIVTLDLETGEMKRITQNQGNNEAPAFSPNGRAIAFSSTRRQGVGIYIANADGTGSPRKVWSGLASAISWGPAPR
jgi:TolB protein